MITRLLYLLALTSLCLSSPLGGFEKELTRLDVDKLHEELKRESEELEEEFAGKETQDELAKLLAAYDISTDGMIEDETEIEIDEDLSEDLFEGDMILTPEQRARALDRDPNGNLLRLQAITNVVRKWTPIGAPVIPYSYADGFPDANKKVITDSLAFWEGRTCIRFRPATDTDKNSLEFNHNSTRCMSPVGMLGGKQRLNLAPGCFTVAAIIHELSHAFGTMHVQTRSDRDDYIIVDTTNIEKRNQHNFMKDPPGWGKMDNYSIPYEFGSMMHYGDKAFAINSTIPTIYAKPQYSKYQGSMGGSRATFFDTLLINRMYNCTAKCTEKNACENNGVQDANKCNKCFCPKGWAGRLCKMRPKTANVTMLTADQTITMEVPPGYGRLVEKLYIVEAPIDKKINASIKSIRPYWYSSCDQIGFEIIPTKDTRFSGIRFCMPDLTPIESDSNQMLVWMYNEQRSKMRTEIEFTLV